jgi:C1A family cysteine protease
MKKLLLLLSLIFFVSCDSYFDFPPDDVVLDPDPIDNTDPFDENVVSPETYGLSESYCYGFNTPDDETVAEIDTNIDFPPFHDLSSLLPQVGSQGKQGSCVAWAAGYYLKSFQENLEDFNNGEVILDNAMSPAFIYNQIKVGSCADGSQIPDALDLILNTGIVSWEEMPYNANECNTLPSEEQNILALENKINSFSYLDGDILFEQTKAFLLSDKPVVIAISIDNEFFGTIEGNGDAVYKEFNKVDGAHAMLVVGYDDDRNAFKVVNSWGINWGNNGFVWIDYKAFQEVLDTDSDFKILCEAWVSEDSNI